MEEVCSNCCSLGSPNQFVNLLVAISAGNYGQRRLYANGRGRFMPERDFHPVNAIYSGITCRCAA